MIRAICFSLLFLFLIGCEDDDSTSDLPAGNEKAIAQTNPNSTSNSLQGQTYSRDSVVRWAVIAYNYSAICDFADHIIERLIRKNKKLEYSNQLGDAYGYQLSPDIWDSLKYYNYHEKDVSFTDERADLRLAGRNPYKERGIFETQTNSHDQMDVRHPLLFQQATSDFYKTEQPKVGEIAIASESSNSVEYNVKLKLRNMEEEYISFTVLLEKQKIVVQLDKAINN